MIDVSPDCVEMQLDPENLRGIILLNFDTKWSGHLHTIRKNQQLSVIGKIYKIYLYDLIREHCEFVDRPGNI